MLLSCLHLREDDATSASAFLAYINDQVSILMRRKDVLLTSISVLTGDEIVLKELVDDLGLKEKTPLLILKVGLLRHSPSGRLLNHFFDSIRIQPIENLPEELPV